jgi:uncharacterized membrane protein YphA (DoxX/SURF4 family)
MTALVEFVHRRWVVRLAGIGMGAVFIAAGLAKIGDVGAFASQIHNFRMAPIWSEHLLAMTLPWIELVAGLCLVFDVRRRAAGALIAALMAVFLVAVGQAVARDLSIECGCFGKAGASTVGLKKMLENAGLLVVSIVATLRPRS